jgi:hypothetical protein
MSPPRANSDLFVSYHPRYKYADDIRAMGDKAVVLVGASDGATEPDALRTLFANNAPGLSVTVLPGLNHFQVSPIRSHGVRLRNCLVGHRGDRALVISCVAQHQVRARCTNHELRTIRLK